MHEPRGSIEGRESTLDPVAGAHGQRLWWGLKATDRQQRLSDRWGTASASGSVISSELGKLAHGLRSGPEQRERGHGGADSVHDRQQEMVTSGEMCVLVGEDGCAGRAGQLVESGGCHHHTSTTRQAERGRLVTRDPDCAIAINSPDQSQSVELVVASAPAPTSVTHSDIRQSGDSGASSHCTGRAQGLVETRDATVAHGGPTVVHRCSQDAACAVPGQEEQDDAEAGGRDDTAEHEQPHGHTERRIARAARQRPECAWGEYRRDQRTGDEEGGQGQGSVLRAGPIEGLTEQLGLPR